MVAQVLCGYILEFRAGWGTEGSKIIKPTPVKETQPGIEPLAPVSASRDLNVHKAILKFWGKKKVPAYTMDQGFQASFSAPPFSGGGARGVSLLFCFILQPQLDGVGLYLAPLCFNGNRALCSD